MSGDKNEILFSQFGINYNNEPEVFRKGTVLVQQPRAGKFTKKDFKISQKKKTCAELPIGTEDLLLSDSVVELTCDIIGDQFWKEYPHLIPLHDNEPINSVPIPKSDTELERNVS